MTSDLRSLTRAALRARQQAVENRLFWLESNVETVAGQDDPGWSREHAQLMQEWEAIEQEWVYRTGLTGDGTMAV